MSGRRLHLLVIDPSLESPEVQGADEVARGWPGRVTRLRPALASGERIGREWGYDDIDAVVVMGSRASVHDEYDWQDDLAAWLAPLVRGEAVVPCLGICYGHQLLAHLAGGQVALSEPGGAKRVGVETTELAASRLLGEPSRRVVVVSHRERVRTPPDGWRVFGRRDGSPIDAIEHPALPLWGVQFHPEARDRFACRAGIDLGDRLADVERDGRDILEAFRDRALARIGGGSG